MAKTGFDMTQASVLAASDFATSDHILVIVDGALYRITATTLQSTIEGAAPELNVKTKSTAYTIGTGDNIVEADTDTAGGVVAFTLSAASNYWNAANSTSKWITVKNTGATDNATITPSGSETIDGASSLTVAAGASASLYTDGSNWHSFAT